MQEHLIIDGNNALHAIPDISKELTKDRNLARDSLLRFLAPLQSNENGLLTVVFDGKCGKGRLYQYEGIKNYTVIYSSSVQGADGVIEKMLIASKFPERISVATNDGLIRNCAFQTGASTIRIEELLKKLDGAINRTKIRLNPQKTNHQEGPLQNRLNIPDIN